MASILDNGASRLTNLLKNLDTLPRTGWLNRGVPADDCETVGQHTDSVVEIVGQLSVKRKDVSFSTYSRMETDLNPARLMAIEPAR